MARGCISWDYGWSFEGDLVNGKLILKRHFHLEVAARNRRINRGCYAVRMLEYNNRQFVPREVLLVVNVFVRSHQQLKAGGLGCRNQISVFQILPASTTVCPPRNRARPLGVPLSKRPDLNYR